MNSLSRCKTALGTYVKITVEGDCEDDKLLVYSTSAFAAIERIERLMSFHDPQSELTRVNQTAHLRPVTISPELYEVLACGLRLSRETEGAFDLTVAGGMVRRGSLPCHGKAPDPGGNWSAIQLERGQVQFKQQVCLDLGGIAKGYAVDCAFSTIPQDLSVVIDAGGDLRMRPWQNQVIGIRVPGCPSERFAVTMQAAAVASSSGDFSQHAHPIISPTTDQPIVSSLGVSVFASCCMLADALTKIGFLQPDNHRLFQAYEAVVIRMDGNGLQHCHNGNKNG